MDPSLATRAASRIGVALCLMLSACAPRVADHVLHIRGSDSQLHLTWALAQAFQHSRPEVTLTLGGGGSGVGLTALIEGTVELATATRALRPEEAQIAARSGVAPVLSPLAMDHVVVIVSAQNPVEALSVDALGELFRGGQTRWESLGWSGPVSLCGRQEGSGTRRLLQTRAVRSRYSEQMQELNGQAQVIDAVSQDPGAIGIISLGAADRLPPTVRVMPLREAPEAPARAPSAADYPLQRWLYQVTDGPPQGLARDFIAFAHSAEGRQIIRDEGFLPLPEDADALGR
ncbi:MAG: substrate-binding domain-containing protein [Alphaproteobacteria bacterium]|nr:substrate-binding domain-containing protein [Alphaproteobacteria bacterium]